jgi:hypothetical protein
MVYAILAYLSHNSTMYGYVLSDEEGIVLESQNMYYMYFYHSVERDDLLLCRRDDSREIVIMTGVSKFLFAAPCV